MSDQVKKQVESGPGIDPKKTPGTSMLTGLTRKPALIVLFSFLYLLNPVGNFIFLVFWNDYPPDRMVKYLYYSSFTKPDPFVLGTVFLWISAVFLAYGLYRVRLWAWYGFLGHSALTVISSLYQASSGEFAVTHAFFINALILIPAGFFLRKEIRKPYFHPRLRWWEQHPRLRDSIRVRLAWNEYKFDETTFDLAPDGIFVQTDNLADIAVGYFFNVRLCFSGEEDRSVQGVVVWINFEPGRVPRGYGVKFIGITRRNRDYIAAYIRAKLRGKDSTSR